MGGLFAASLLKVMVSGDVWSLQDGRAINGFPVLNIPWWKQSIIEFIGTFFLMTMVYMTAVDGRKAENVHGMAIGGVVGFMLLAGPAGSATALNPARAFCPMLLDVDNGQFWKVFVWIVFPTAGAIVAGLMCEWFLLDNGQGLEGQAGPVRFRTITMKAKDPNATVDVDLVGNNDLEAGINADVEIELSANVDVDADFQPEVEIEVGVDWNAWGAPKDDQKVNWTGFYVQAGASNEMNFDNMSIGFDGAINGAGDDTNGPFTLEGTLNGDCTFEFNKTYESGNVFKYSGQ